MLLLAIFVLAVIGYWLGKRRLYRLIHKAGEDQQLSSPASEFGAKFTSQSIPSYYGYFAALWCGIPALALLFFWVIFQGPVIDSMIEASFPPAVQNLSADERTLLISQIKNNTGTEDSPYYTIIVTAQTYFEGLQNRADIYRIGLTIAVAVLGLLYGLRRIVPAFRARQAVERLVRGFLMLASTLAILTTIGIILSLTFEAWRFFSLVSPIEFFFGINWSPQISLRADQVASSGSFGAIPIFAGTLLITLIAMLIAGPIGLFSAIYLAEYASPRFRARVKPGLEILAGVPTVVYGVFAALSISPLLRGLGEKIGLDVASESALAAGMVMGVMIIPFISSLSDDVIAAVPGSLREGALGLGATRSEMIRLVVLPAALPGIVGAFLLAISRAIGETMIVVMAAGLAANLTANPFEAVTTVTVQIVTLLIGDQEFDSAKTLAAFALGLTLFLVTLGMNVAALVIQRRFKEQYD